VKSKSPEIILLDDSDNDDNDDHDHDNRDGSDDDDNDDHRIIITTPYGSKRHGDGSGNKVSQWWKQRFPVEFLRDEEIKFHLSL